MNLTKEKEEAETGKLEGPVMSRHILREKGKPEGHDSKGTSREENKRLVRGGRDYIYLAYPSRVQKQRKHSLGGASSFYLASRRHEYR